MAFTTSMDSSIGFSQVGGLRGHIKRLKEMILFPFIYQDVYKKFKIKPPRGVLLYGPPGTGKTLIAGALASECSRANKKVSFFIHNGAECLSKWVGESENHLRNLFEKAQELRPTIIFFDEIDGLAPIRTSQENQVHSSVVSTLLALMDGLQSKGQVVIIGATNRIDVIDPALRRPGRFDCELYFPLPDFKARYEILMVHGRSLGEDVDSHFMKYLAANTEGYCGADLQSLCSEAVMSSLRRQFPQIYSSDNPININIPVLHVEQRDFHKAKSSIVPASFRVSYSPRKKLPSKIRLLFGHTLCKVMASMKTSSLSQFLHSKTGQGSKDGDPEDPEPEKNVQAECNQNGLKNCIHFLLAGSAEQGQTDYLGPAILHCLEDLSVTTLDIASLFESSGKTPEEACIQRIRETRQSLPGILYLPDIGSWWQIADDATKAVFLSMIRELDSTDCPVLVLATANSPYDSLPPEFHEIFKMAQGQVYSMENPTEKSRRKFFSQFFRKARVLPAMKNNSYSGKNQVLSCKVQESLLPSAENPEMYLNKRARRRVKRNNCSTSSSEAGSYECENSEIVLKKRKRKSSKLYTQEKIVKMSDNSVESNLKEKENCQQTAPLMEDPNKSGNSHELSNDEEKDEECLYDCEVRLSSSYSGFSLDYGKGNILSDGINTSSESFAIYETQLQDLVEYAVNITEDCTLQAVLDLYSRLTCCSTKYRDFCDPTNFIEELKSTMKAFEDNIVKQKNME